MAALYYVIGSLISIGGFIGGIVFGSNTQNFGFCFLVWMSTFLEVIIYFGIGAILSNPERLLGQLDYYVDHAENMPKSKLEDLTLKISSDNPEKPVSVVVEKNTPVGENEWKCPKCGAVNQNYVGTCGCGESKP